MTWGRCHLKSSQIIDDVIQKLLQQQIALWELMNMEQRNAGLMFANVPWIRKLKFRIFQIVPVICNLLIRIYSMFYAWEKIPKYLWFAILNCTFPSQIYYFTINTFAILGILDVLPAIFKRYALSVCLYLRFKRTNHIVDWQ